MNNSPKHGGCREGAGRPSLGVTRKVSITLPDEIWNEIEREKGDLAMSAFLRDLVMHRSKGGESS
ncbi:CopG family transcriptional regulator [Peribacillus frigoritolerans]|uniref:CopG family transcriptional regulator n=1 Tax=Peribacillus frigoritolerans TaxID=450367 RepID=UPI003B8B14F3